ncbi:hypothetical protein K2F43_00785 [Clostridium estertheticum]|uniref:hypothetical protein n=1 Tax=Clostridium estertheticum TaxID=238834 RepID=UPI001C6E18B9|nr:hypothetical protein [Clostridium estertheticum]MBW9169736.1 hypothetical protein [Clostridium estertheticum]WLC74756.1 hypothetical protein KTC99_18680 [Clostridium estertheticum]
MEKLFVVLSIIFLMLFVVCGIALIIGCVKPQLVIKWGDYDKRNKKNVLKYYGISLIVCFILLLTTYTSLENVKAVKVAKAEVELAKKVASDKVIADKKVADKVIADKLVADKVKANKLRADKIIAEKVKSDELKADKLKEKTALANKIIEDREIAHKAIIDESAKEAQDKAVSAKKALADAVEKSNESTREYNRKMKALDDQINAIGVN